MRTLDKILCAVFVVALVVLFIFRQCQLDLYCLILGLAVALMSGVAMFMQRQKKEDESAE